DGQRGSARRAAAARLHRRWYARHLPALAAGSDLCHWHCADPEWLGGLRHVPPGVPVVLSFWGSDLYRQEGVRTYALQARACGRADRLTVGSVEMREVLLAKFGRHLAPKVRLAHYGAANLDAAAAGRRHRDDFLARHGLPADRVRVVVGNSGGPGNRHPEVLARLAALPPDLLARVTVLLPMSYGGDEAYRAEVRRVAARMPFDARVLDAFLPDPEVGALRAATDVLVHVPVSDQFSAAMCEAVAAGAVLVAGAWLPYSRLRLAGVPYREVGELDDLSGAVAAVLADWPAAKRAAEAAGPRVRPLAAWGEVVRGWDAVYRELLPARGEGGDAGGDPGRRVGDAAAAVHRGDPQAAAPARG
ncbi:MAG: hypothetical protein K2X82_31630, partial [Gemmataceae bacterium]|nr:hypothetical protein [Gemmataceae bacterium]